MNMELFSKKDFWAGMMFIGIGAGSIILARDYRFGSALRMGPGFFPVILGWVLILFGAYVMVRGVRSNEKIKVSWSPRALILLPLSLLLFGILMKEAGFIPAVAAVVFGSAAAGREFKLSQVLLATGFLIVLSTGIFIWGINLPYPLIKGF
jgi:hypothetical protein